MPLSAPEFPPPLPPPAPPILHRLKAFFQTPTLLDVQFALRIDELLTYATPIGLLDLVGRCALGGGRGLRSGGASSIL